jgi:hypothetical protein
MGATITDAMLQAGVRYETVVRPRVLMLIQRYPEGRTTSGFLQLLNEVGPNVLLDWSDHEKPSRVLHVTEYFVQQKIGTEADLKTWLQDPAHISALKSLRGIGDKTADYFKILVGISTSAIDRHLYDFLAQAGIQVKDKDYHEAQAIIHAAAEILKVSRADLDHSIWKYMSSRERSDKHTPGSQYSTRSGSYVLSRYQNDKHAVPEDVNRSAAGSQSITEFSNDATYLRWLDSHPTGYVLNINRNNADDVKLHRASCGYIRVRDRNLTTGAPEKVGSDSKADLLKEAQRRFGQEPDYCRCLA